MSLLSRLADRLILCPSSQPIDANGKRREMIDCHPGQIEAWVGSFRQERSSELGAAVIKFPGTAGRAERAGVHPAEIWGIEAEVWAINPHGYGGSESFASIQNFPAMVHSVVEHVRSRYPHKPIAVVGNSLGCISALFAAANYPIDALVLRNPPPIRTMIRQRPRYAAWNFGLSRLIANEVPEQLDCVANAAQSKVPCLLIQAASDRIVPVKYQDLVFEAYAGPIKKFLIADADHHELVQEDQLDEYFQALRWCGSHLQPRR